MFPLIRNGVGFAHGQQYDVKVYAQNISKFISMDLQQIKEMLFYQILDKNKDKLICETDLFKLLSELKSKELSYMMADDLIILLKSFTKLRKEKGLTDEYKLKLDKIY